MGLKLSSWAVTGETIKFVTRSKGINKSVSQWGIDNTWASWNNTQESIKNAGSTHTLEQFSNLIETARRDRKRFFCPELHSIAEATVGAAADVEFMSYWGTDLRCSGQFYAGLSGKSAGV